MSPYAKRVLTTTAFLLLISISYIEAAVEQSSLSISSESILPPDTESLPFVQLGKKLYHFDVSNWVNWFQAAHMCREMNANLASIDSIEEKNLIRNYIMQHYQYNYFWLSGNNLGNEYEFRSIKTGQKLSYSFWGVNEPDNRNVENCVELRFKKDIGFFDMNSRVCTEPNNFICETDVAAVTLEMW